MVHRAGVLALLEMVLAGKFGGPEFGSLASM